MAVYGRMELTMEKIIVDGGYPLSGKVDVSGMKNAAVAVIFASVVVSGVCVIENLPCISDVSDSLDILKSVGANVRILSGTKVEIDTTRVSDAEAPLELVRKLRASYYLLGALLARFGKAEVSLPGGCATGGMRGPGSDHWTCWTVSSSQAPSLVECLM